MKPTLAGVILCVLAMVLGGDARADKPTRLALVIGNDKYERPLRPLANAANDARLIAAKLKGAGFTVFESYNAKAASIAALVGDLTRRLRYDPPGSIGVFFYAGHGTEKNGVNYIIASDTKADLGNSVRLDELLQKFGEAKDAAKIVILDACRSVIDRSEDAEFARGFLASVTPSGTLIAYSTSPGAIALDSLGSGNNSPFTAALAATMSEPGLKIEDVFKVTRLKLFRASKGKQISWEVTSLVGDVYLVPETRQLDAAYQSARDR